MDGGGPLDAVFDGGSDEPTVVVTGLAGIGHAGTDAFAWLEHPADGQRAIVGYGTQGRQPTGPSVDLSAEHLLFGHSTAGGSFRWLAVDQATDVVSIPAPEDFWYLYRSDGERLLDDDTITGPVVVHWTGEDTVLYPVVEDLWLSILGEASDGSYWVNGRGPGEAVIDGASLGEAGETVHFVARLDEAGLSSVLRYGTGTLDGTRLWMPGDELLVSLRAAATDTFLGEAVGGEAILARFDPTDPATVQRWAVSEAPGIQRIDGGIEVTVRFSSPESPTLGEHGYEALVSPYETWVRLVWDGMGDLPEGERWARDPRFVDSDGVSFGAPIQEVFSVLDADHREVFHVSASLPVARDIRRCGDAVCFITQSEEPFELTVARGEETTITEVAPPAPAPGHAILDVLRLSLSDGSILQRATFDLGPIELSDYPEGMAVPLGDSHFVVGRSRSGEPIQTVEVHAWSGGSRALSLDAPDGCQVRMRSRWGTDRRDLRDPDSHAVLLASECAAGPHHVNLEGVSFEYETPRATTVFDVRVE